MDENEDVLIVSCELVSDAPSVVSATKAGLANRLGKAERVKWICGFAATLY